MFRMPKVDSHINDLTALKEAEVDNIKMKLSALLDKAKYSFSGDIPCLEEVMTNVLQSYDLSVEVKLEETGKPGVYFARFYGNHRDVAKIRDILENTKELC